MALYYTLALDGSFTAGDSVTGFTCYAFPSSPHAEAAKHNPSKVAAEMIEKENNLEFTRKALAVKGYDRMNWTRIYENSPNYTVKGFIELAIQRHCTPNDTIELPKVPFSQREG